MTKRKILLIGNGLNLVSDGGASWNALLNSLAGTPKTRHESEVRKAKPFTLWFEEVASGGQHRQFKDKVIVVPLVRQLPWVLYLLIYQVVRGKSFFQYDAALLHKSAAG